MIISPLAGKLAPPALLVNVAGLVAAYYSERPDPKVAGQRVAFGTSGHRGSSLDTTFNEWHVLAISQAVCDYRKTNSISGRSTLELIPTLCRSPHLRVPLKSWAQTT